MFSILTSSFRSIQDPWIFSWELGMFYTASGLVISYLLFFGNLCRSSDDGTCRIWDARYSQWLPRIYVPSPSDASTGKKWYIIIFCSVLKYVWL